MKPKPGKKLVAKLIRRGTKRPASGQKAVVVRKKARRSSRAAKVRAGALSERKQRSRGDMYLNQVLKTVAKKKPAGGAKVNPIDLIFPEERKEKLGKMGRRTGLDAFTNTMARLATSSVDSPYAMPATGDFRITNPDPKHIKAIRAAQKDMRDRITAAVADGADELLITAALRVEAANITTLTPFFHTPGNAQEAYNLPKSYVEQIRWSRIMYNLNPYIAQITDLKAFYPVSKFKISTPEPFVTAFYEQNAFNKHFNLYSFMRRMNLSKKKFGEAIMWGTKRQDGVWPQTGQPRWVWANFILLEPELVEIKKEVMGDPQPKYFLRPNRDFEELVKRLEQNDPSVAHLQGTIAPAIISKIKSRDLIPLDPTTISSIQVLTDASAERGTPPYQRLFVNFTFEDFVRLALMAQAQRYHFPIELWTIGNAEKNIWPGIPQLEQFRDMVYDAIMSPPFTLFFPPIVDYKALGVDGHLIDPKNNMDYAHRQYLIGMGVNEDMILGSSAMFNSNESAGNQVFIRMVQTDRDDLEEWARWNFFEPLAQWNNLKIEKNGQLVPIIPELEWEKTLDFKAQEDERKNLTYAKEHGMLDPDTWIEAVLNRNPEEIKARIRKAIGGVFDDGKLGGAARDAVLQGNGKPQPAVAAPGGGQASAPNETVPEEAGGGGGAGAPPAGGGKEAAGAPEAGGGGGAAEPPAGGAAAPAAGAP